MPDLPANFVDNLMARAAKRAELSECETEVAWTVRLKRLGYSDREIANLMSHALTEEDRTG